VYSGTAGREWKDDNTDTSDHPDTTNSDCFKGSDLRAKKPVSPSEEGTAGRTSTDGRGTVIRSENSPSNQ
jgi:hypothetical protein